VVCRCSHAGRRSVLAMIKPTVWFVARRSWAGFAWKLNAPLMPALAIRAGKRGRDRRVCCRARVDRRVGFRLAAFGHTSLSRCLWSMRRVIVQPIDSRAVRAGLRSGVPWICRVVLCFCLDKGAHEAKRANEAFWRDDARRPVVTDSPPSRDRPDCQTPVPVSLSRWLST